MLLPGSAGILAACRDRAECACHIGKRIVEMVRLHLKPSGIMTRDAFRNAIVVNSAYRRLNQCADPSDRDRPAYRRRSVDPFLADTWSRRAIDGQLAIGWHLSRQGLLSRRRCACGGSSIGGKGLICEDALSINCSSIGQNCRGGTIEDLDVIRPIDRPLHELAGILVRSGDLFNSEIMKTSVISDEFRAQAQRL